MIRAFLAIGLAVFAAAGGAAQPLAIRVNAFPNAKALPLHAGIAKGIFEKRGLTIELALTDNSRNQRDGLAAGKHDIVHSAVDNALAMIEGATQDVVIVAGGDSGMNEFFVQSDINTFADLKGRTIIVDAPDTAYALQAKKIMAQHGMKEGADYAIKPVGAGVFRFKAMTESRDNAAAILNLPFTVQAAQMGMKSLGRTTDFLGPYQGAGAFTMRAWAERNRETLEQYLAAYVESVRWVRTPANRGESVAMLMDKLKISSKEAQLTYDQLLDPDFGFTPDAAFSAEGFRNVLALRAELERKPGAAAPPQQRYVDLGYYERAIKLVGK